MKKHIPNLLTLGNLLSGTIAIIFALKGDFVGTAVLVTAGIVFDFFELLENNFLPNRTCNFLKGCIPMGAKFSNKSFFHKFIYRYFKLIP